VGNGNIEVGSKTTTRKADRPSVRRLLGSNILPQLRISERVPSSEILQVSEAKSGAMAEQRGDSGRGDQSAPQKLVRLVGCRETKELPEPASEASPTKR
jgi:hypothetical protein